MPSSPEQQRKTLIVSPAAGRHFAKVNKTAGYKAMVALSANLPSPPQDFEPDKYYRVQLTQAIEHAGHWLRPSDDVVMLGSFAQEHAESISGARRIGE